MKKRRKHYRDTGFTSQISLELPERPAFSLCGVQPLISDRGRISDSLVFFTGRRPKRADWGLHPGRYCFMQYCEGKRRFGAENIEITREPLSDSAVEQVVLREVMNGASDYDCGESLTDVSPKELYKVLMSHYYTLRVTTYGAAPGSVVATSDSSVAERLRGRAALKVVLLDENLLDRRTVIVAAARMCSFANPIVACPFIERDELADFCRAHHFDTSSIVFDSGKKYPFLEAELDWYEIYGHYLRTVGSDSWHVETFSRVPDYYHVLHFNP